MTDVYSFIGAKTYNDFKLALMMTSNFFHSKFRKSQGVIFSCIYSSCIAKTPLFQEKRRWFHKYFPLFIKYGAGQRLFQVAHNTWCEKSGMFWRGFAALEKSGPISDRGSVGGRWDYI